MIWPVVFHRLLFVHWIDTICPFKSGRSVWAVRLYFFYEPGIALR